MCFRKSIVFGVAGKVVDGSEEEGSEGRVGEQRCIGRAKKQQAYWVYSQAID